MTRGLPPEHIQDQLDIIAKNGFKRISDNISFLWEQKDHGELKCYMDGLIIDRRGNRQGFPHPVMAAILKIYPCVEWKCEDIWNENYGH